MRVRPLITMVMVASVLASTAQRLSAQAKDTLSYELLAAVVEPAPPRAGFVTVSFGASVPERYLAVPNAPQSDGARWQIVIRDRKNPAITETVVVKSVFVESDPAQNHLVSLEPDQPLNPTTHEIQVRFLEANFPDVVVGQPPRSGANAFYAPAKGKDDADVYFKGLAVGTTASKPAYSIDAKLAYTKPLGTTWGSLGAVATYVVDKASDIGPDTVTVSTAYSNVWSTGGGRGVILTVEPAGYELDASNETRNFRSAARGQLVVPSVKVGKKSYVTGDLVLGYEAGHRRKGGSPQDRGLFRTLVGVCGYALLQGSAVIKRVDLSAAWTVRLLAQDEPTTRLVSGTSVTSTNDDARHLVTVAGAFMVSKALGFSLGYRHGSEPPTYKHVKHRGEFGVLIKLKQVNRG